VAILGAFLLSCGTGDSPGRRPSGGGESARFTGAPGEVKLITLDPGHFHAALVQKTMYEQVDPRVHVFAPEGADVQAHLLRIEGFNTRDDDPTEWVEVVYTGDDFLERMLQEKPGNLVIISGNNARKAAYIRSAVKAGFNVLADKPMAIKPADFPVLEEAFRIAGEKGVVLDDIMTERFEITSILQRRLSQFPALFGELVPGSPEEPAVAKESVHHFSKVVAGSQLIRPAWFFDVAQQGEGIVDVTTHLVDLIHWQAFPGEGVEIGDVEVLSARRWTTDLTPDQFERVTKLEVYPSYLAGAVGEDSVLGVYANGEIVYRVKGIHAKVTVEWRYEAPNGTGDTHRSVMRGSKARLSVRQGEAEGYEVTLYVEPAAGVDRKGFEATLSDVMAELAREYPGLATRPAGGGWALVIPEEYKVGHEAHFAQVTERYLRSLVEGGPTLRDIQSILTRYFVTTRAYELAQS
jgi:predicted dehydrogenase